MWSWTHWDIPIQDFRYALRGLAKSPGFAATAILTLALAIGAGTAVFTVVDSVLLQPLAYHDSGKLVVAWERVRFISNEPLGPNPRHVDIWRRSATAFSGLTMIRNAAMGLAMGTEHPRLTGTVLCLPDLFDVLEVQPLLGRGFTPENGIEGHDNVAIITYPLWQTLFHGDPGALGKTIRIGDTAHQVIGVLPPGFHFPNANALRAFPSRQPLGSPPEPAVFLPAVMNFSQMAWNGNYANWVTLGRLKPGVGMREAEAQLATIQVQVQRQIPGMPADPHALGAAVQPMREVVVGESATALWLLLAAVMGLMLIACLNLANAQLGRALARSHDVALRTALGAATWRLVWSAFSENLLLAGMGGAGGLALAAAALALLRRYSPIDLPRLDEVRLNWTVLGFALLLTFAASLLFGVLPALRLLAGNRLSPQQSQARTLGSRQGRRVRKWLIAVQVCGCTVLLLVTGLFSKSLLHLLRQDKGFETGRVAVAEVRLAPQTYGTDRSRIAFDDAVLANLRGIPGVRTATLVSAMPLEGESWIEPVLRVDNPALETPLLNLRWVAPGYFETIGQRLVAGRFLEERDRNAGGIVLSEALARALWRDASAIGGQVRVEDRPFTVVGVVGDSHGTSLKTRPVRTAYVHYQDRPPYNDFFLVRAAGSAEAAMPAMRQAIWKYDPDATIARVKTLDAQLSDSLAAERFQTLLLVSFGAAALLLAMLGIYGVLSYAVVTRKQEIGVRMALGAARSRVYALTLGEAATPVFTGLLAGLAASAAAGQAIQKLLYGTQALDPAVMLTVASLFLASAGAAAWLPARRAASIDPMEALRSE